MHLQIWAFILLLKTINSLDRSTNFESKQNQRQRIRLLEKECSAVFKIRDHFNRVKKWLLLHRIQRITSIRQAVMAFHSIRGNQTSNLNTRYVSFFFLFFLFFVIEWFLVLPIKKKGFWNRFPLSWIRSVVIVHENREKYATMPT